MINKTWLFHSNGSADSFVDGVFISVRIPDRKSLLEEDVVLMRGSGNTVRHCGWCG